MIILDFDEMAQNKDINHTKQEKNGISRRNIFGKFAAPLLASAINV